MSMHKGIHKQQPPQIHHSVLTPLQGIEDECDYGAIKNKKSRAVEKKLPLTIN
jgi:hypothetical protein